MPQSGGTTNRTAPLRRAPLLARPAKNTAPSPEDKEDEFDLLDALLDDDEADEEEKINNKEKTQPPPLTTKLPQGLKTTAKPIAATTLPEPVDPNTSTTSNTVAIGKKTNPFSRPTLPSSGGGGVTTALPRSLTLARQAPPTSINIDSSEMLQSVLGPAMAFKKPSVVPPPAPPPPAAAAAEVKKAPPAAAPQNKNTSKSKKEINRLLLDNDDDDDDFVKPAPKKPLISRQVPLIRKPPQQPAVATTAAATAATTTTVGGGSEQRPLVNSVSKSGGTGQRFQAPRMTQPPLPQQQQQYVKQEQHELPPPRQQQQQRQRQQMPAETEIIDLSKDEYPAHPESAPAAVRLPDPYLDHQQQQQPVYGQPAGGATEQQEPQIWRAPQDTSFNNNNNNTSNFARGDGALGIFAPPVASTAAAAAAGGIFAQPQQQLEHHYQQQQDRNGADWTIPAMYNNTINQQYQQQQHDQPHAAAGGATAGGEFSTGTRSWWYRLPDLVPVSVLQHGYNPRDGTIVHIDYKNQFSGKSGGGATAAAKKAARAAGAGATKSRTSTKSTGGLDTTTSTKGYWLTISGVKTYISDGKELTGRAAWSASKKDNGQDSGGSGSGRKKTKGASGARKRATKKSRR